MEPFIDELSRTYGSLVIYYARCCYRFASKHHCMLVAASRLIYYHLLLLSRRLWWMWSMQRVIEGSERDERAEAEMKFALRIIWKIQEICCCKNISYNSEPILFEQSELCKPKVLRTRAKR